MENEKKELKYAILIDADNIANKYVKIILDETTKNGVATYKRIYGDWTSTKLSSWKNVLLDNSIIPMQQYSYTSGKNATDSAMIIDAMDILYSGTVDGFCIVSSDSDFTRLAARLRESGMQVIGMGESKTPKPFISACNQFKYLDLLYDNEQKGERDHREEETVETKGQVNTQPSAKKAPSAKKRQPGPQTSLKMIKKALRSIVEEFSDDDGWIFLAEAGNQLAKRFPDFDVRNFGCSRLTPFIESMGMFEVERRSTGNHNVQLVYFRLKDNDSKKNR